MRAAVPVSARCGRSAATSAWILPVSPALPRASARRCWPSEPSSTTLLEKPTSMTEHEPVQLIADEQDRLAREFERLPTSGWTAPSRCAGWSNASVIGHLAFHAGVYRDTVSRA